MQQFKYLLLPTIFALTSCVSISDIVPAGKDTWMVTGSNTRIGADATMKAELYKKASDYCAGQNKYFVPVSQNYINLVIGRPGNVDLTFRCLVEGDPELSRPIMKKIPDTSIEVIQK